MCIQDIYVYRYTEIIFIGGIYNDYYIYSYYIGIPAGMTTVSFSIQINDDSLIEGYESFNIYVHEDSLPNVYVGSHNRATVTIVDDDCEYLRICMYVCMYVYICMYVCMYVYYISRLTIVSRKAKKKQ